MNDFSPEKPSKSELKRQASRLQELGVALVDVSVKELTALDLPEKLQQAIIQAQGIRQGSGRKRQLQYIGKLMRELEEERVADIEALLAGKQQTRQSAAQDFKRIENWRDRLIKQSQAVEEFIQQYPHADAQQLQGLRDAAADELKRDKGAPRALFRYIKEVLEQ